MAKKPIFKKNHQINSWYTKYGFWIENNKSWHNKYNFWFQNFLDQNLFDLDSFVLNFFEQQQQPQLQLKWVLT